MNKLFVQILLSVMVGVGAALGLNPDVESEYHDTYRNRWIEPRWGTEG